VSANVAAASIVDLARRIADLDSQKRTRVERIFQVTETVGHLDPPDEMRVWIEKLFGSVDAVRSQHIVRVTNRVTFEGALFNELRARRPMEAKGAEDARAEIAKSEGDPFCHPETGTPADVFGRIRGAHAQTASNIAKYDGFHGVLVFDEHDPTATVDAVRLRDHFATARRWAEDARRTDPEARYFFLMWNALWRAGGSIVHAHMQMTATRGSHYPKVEAIRAVATDYRARHARDYFDDLVAAHEAVGLARRVDGAAVVATLTPIKERELVVVAPPGEDERALVPALARALAAHRALGVISWNMALFLPPLSPDGGDWSAFRTHARLVDRGDPGNRTSDIGAMELFASGCIVADPFVVAAQLRA
jgi:hypothetical protein